MKATIRIYEGEGSEYANRFIEETYKVKPGTEVELVTTQPFISSYYNTPELPHYLCRMSDNTMKVIIATDLIIDFDSDSEQNDEWKEFHKKASIAALSGLLSNENAVDDLRNVARNQSTTLTDEIVRASVGYADDLTKWLKRKFNI